MLGVMDHRRQRFEHLYRAHRGDLLAYALRRATPQEAQDAVAEAFLAAWRGLDRVPGDPLPWLIGITRRTLANQRRGTRRRTALVERIAGEGTPESRDPADRAERGATLRALATLGERDREALCLIAWEGLTPAQAAEALGIPGTVFRVRLHRARQRLAVAMGEREPGGHAPPVPEGEPT